MKVLVVIATKLEALGIFPKLDSILKADKELFPIKADNLSFDLLISGIGGYFTIFKLTKQLVSKKYDYVINLGIAGSFSKEIQIGELVQVISDKMIDLGFEDEKGNTDIFEANLHSQNSFPFTNGYLKNDELIISGIKKIKAVSSSIAHGKASTIDNITTKYNPDIESMEGASVFYVCKQLFIPCIQIRAISNYVEKRDKSNWNIPLALENLSNKITFILTELSKIC